MQTRIAIAAVLPPLSPYANVAVIFVGNTARSFQVEIH